MSSCDAIRWGTLLLGLLGISCSQGGEYEPRLHRLVPGWGLTTAPVSGVIQGENFLSVPTQHVGGEEKVTLDSHFEVHLGEHLLEEVAWADERTLSVRIPQGLPAGWYPLTVMTPLGVRARLPRAYYASDRPLASLTTQTLLERERLWVGEETHLVLTVENPGGTRALDVRALLRPVEPGGVEILSEPSALDVEPGGRASFTWTLGAVSTGAARFSLELEGREELSGMALQASPQVAALQVAERASPSSTLFFSPLVVNVGQPFTLTLRVTNNGADRLRDVRPGFPTVLGVSVALLPEPVPSRVDLGPQESQDFVWRTVRATSAGQGLFKVRASGTDDLTGDEVPVPEVSASPLTVLTRGHLAARFTQVPTSVLVGQVFDVEVSVDNLGQSGVRGAVLDGAGLAQGSQTCRVRLLSVPMPRSADIPAGGQQVFHAQLQADQAGSCTFRVGAQGQDVTDGLPVVAGLATSASVTIIR